MNANERLNVDEYMLTQGQIYFLEGWHQEQTSFEIFVRSLPGKDIPDPRGQRTYLVAAGLDQALEYLERVRASEQHLRWLAEDGYDPAFIEFMRTWRFRGSVDAVAEGTIVTNQVPLATVSGSRFDCQMVESALLGIFGPNTLFTTKAARIVQAAKGRPLWDFGLRRAQDPAVAHTVARQSYIAGFAGTATWESAKLLGIPSAGTMAHHFIMRSGPEGEQGAFETFFRHFPQRTVALPDTYSTPGGIDKGMNASEATGIPFKSVRLDSGDLTALSIQGREMLDERGYAQTQMGASNDLHEYSIADMIEAGARIDWFGVGTMLATSADAPALGIVYKLTEQEIDGVTSQCMKLAPGKQTDPGMHAVWRRPDGQLVLALADEHLDGAERLTRPAMRDGKRLVSQTIHELREHTMAEIARMPEYARFGHGARPLTIERTRALWQLRASLGDTEAEV
jgi:nicotinate phosphoribosyltransferase